MEDVGTGGDRFERGDAVTVLPSVRPLGFGTYGETILVPDVAVVAQPPELSAVEAAALWVAHLTAYAPLVEIAEVGPGDVVLINAASSSVGLAAISIVRRLNATPVALTRTRRKADLLLRLGAEAVIVTDEEDVVGRTHALTAGAGARVAFDAVAGPALTTLLHALAPGGIVVQYGLLSQEPMLFPLDVSARKLTITGYGLDLATDTELRRRAYRFVKDGVAAGAFRPVVADTFPLSAAAEAHAVLERNTHIGKIVLIP
ncbi:zinc-binding dehydrogenase [Streptomyces malaysiensis subsp. malaysiensis]|uniref:zinc-binding dehydrogenase n=1 Tax=Streptomyces sp. NA07423 TaxID=3042026 RepID=UPI0024BF7F2F|nr:zinc-binding dehydrogenase [Streptomyces sp. NA07423]WHX23739.1 zinc-binding dehydrogenase [Streptomyces sp. NA07423]